MNNKDNIAVPEEFRFCFWDTTFEDLDKDKDKDFIIIRLFVKGGIRGKAWVENTYTYDEIRNAAKKRRDMNSVIAHYLQTHYDLKKEEMAYYIVDAMGGHELWPY